MPPLPKKSRPNSQAPDGIPTDAPESTSRSDAKRPSLANRGLANDKEAADESNDSPSRTSWYGGSWRRKAEPVAQVARESVSVAGGATSESSEREGCQTGPYMNNHLKRSRKSIPLVAEATHVNATGSNTEAGKSGEKLTEAKDATETKTVDTKDLPKNTPVEPPLPPEPPKDATVEDSRGQPKQDSIASGLFGWWSRPDGYVPSEADKAKADPKLGDAMATEAQETLLPLSPVATRNEQAPDTGLDGEQSPANGQHEMAEVNRTSEGWGTGRSWFKLWSATQNQQAQEDPSAAPTQQAPSSNQNTPNKPPEQTSASKPPEPVTRPAEPDKAANESRPQADSDENRATSSGWAFWLKDPPKDQTPTPGGTQKHLGELAVADTPSQSHPEAAQFNEEQAQRTKDKVDSKASSIKDGKPPKKTVRAEGAFATQIEGPPPVPSSDQEPGKQEAAKITAATKGLKTAQSKPNLILPAFKSSYPPAQITSYWERLGQYLASQLRLVDAATTTPNHVYLSPTPPKVKNAIAIGVHGYFPAPIIQKVLGQPTGTSIRFANFAASAVRWWTEEHQPEVDCEIEQVALEGEGFIADRVDTLWKLLLNWLSHLRKADLILVACHSQGVPVAIMLLAKLIQLGCLSSSVKIGVCAMAGVNLGPFADFKSKFFGGSAAELFEFSNPKSRVSKEYANALDIALRCGVRITYVGSIDDQLVSLESSLFANLTHPYVQRAVFIDGRLYAPDFITALVAFTLKLRNIGISDHGLIRELTFPLAGSLYGGEGHSRVYNDEAVYRLALEFALETTDIDPKTVVHPSGAINTLTDEGKRSSLERRRSQGGIPTSTTMANSIRRGSLSAVKQPGVAPYIAPYESSPSLNTANPYYLPWALRGILEEGEVKREMQNEVKELVRLFDEWKPTTKQLKDVKFRLEAVKSKL